MASDRILLDQIARLGQSQGDRLPAALDPAFAPIDGRGPAERLAEVRRLAAHLRHYGFDPDKADGNWSAFFPADGAALLATKDGSAPPHLGLYGAFLNLLEPARGALNDLTGRHLDFQYDRVLGFKPRPAEPEHAHLTLELKKGAAPWAVTPAQRFNGGKDAGGAERRYAPLRETVIGHGQLAALHSVYRDADGVWFAPVANSADGLGAALPAGRPGWRAFGRGKLPNETDLPKAPVGFAFGAPVLRMAEGRRTVTIDLTLVSLPPTLDGSALAGLLHAYVSGQTGWLGHYKPTGTRSGNTVSLTFSLAEGEPAVIDVDAALHGGAWASDAPIVQLVLRPEAAHRYADLAVLRVARAAIRVRVEGVRNLALENDFGALNPKKAFQPFGPQPVVGGRFQVGCAEALSKQLTDLSIALRWQGAPGSLSGWYASYPSQTTIANGVSAQLSYADRSGTTTRHTLDLMARTGGVTTLSPTSPAPGSGGGTGQIGFLYSLMSAGSVFGKLFGKRYQQMHPVFLIADTPPPARQGFVTVALQADFLHAEYRKETMRLAKAGNNTTVLNEPYTPTVQEISLNYSATSPVTDFSLPDEGAFAAGLDLQFFHVGPFGQRREHGFLRQQLAWVTDKAISLLPAFPDAGEFIIGLTGLGAGESIQLLLQVAEGSADPQQLAEAVRWSVLCDNHWRAVAPDELALDTSRGLRASGLVGFVLSRDTTTENTWLPAGPVWLKAAIAAHPAAACQLVGVHPNAIEVVRVWPAGTTPPVDTLPAGSIAKLLSAPAGLKQVAQPYATFGGRAAETETLRNRRAAEHLRHRQRCITPWDYERLLLEAFPSVHRIKCIPHASDSSWMAPGHVLIVAIPDLRNHNAIDRLQPRVDLDTLTRMSELAQQHAAPQVSVCVRNAEYVPIRLDFKVRFKPGLPFDYSRGQLHTAIVRALSPWAFASEAPLQFGGRLYRSVLLDFIEELPYVDYVTDFRCGLAGPDGRLLNDVAEITVSRPDAILVSAPAHGIAEAP